MLLKKVEITFSRDIGRRRRRGFCAIVQGIGRTTIPHLPKSTVPAAKRVGDDLLESAVPETADVVSGRKNIKTAAKTTCVWESV